jgi:Alcohol acetyltransferase
MGITLSGTMQKPRWVRLKEIDLSKVVKFVKGDSRQVLEDAHQVGFTWGELPLWRVVVIIPEDEGNEGIEVAFFIHHAVGDGKSGFAFHLDFRDALNVESSTEGDNPGNIVQVPKLDLVPSLEEAHSLPLSYWFIATQFIKSILPKSKDERHWTGAPIRSEKNITNLRLLYLPSSILGSLLEKCRQHDVTLTALLTVTIARVLAKVYHDYNRFNCTCAMSFRRFTGTGDRAMCVYVTSYTQKFSTDSLAGYIPCDTFSWDAIQSCFKEIKSATASPANQQVGLLNFVDNYAGFFKGKLGKEREYSFEVSNVGVFDPRDQSVDDGNLNGRVKLDRILFSQGSNVISPGLVFCVASAKGGELGIGLTWQEDVVVKEDAEKVLKELEAELRGLAKDDEDTTHNAISMTADK